tara:strand:- start:126778 stop:127041 length:264 start_codon:yes stop_codon:yes gene_type:complete
MYFCKCKKCLWRDDGLGGGYYRLFEEGKVYEVSDYASAAKEGNVFYYNVRYGGSNLDTWGVSPQTFKDHFYNRSEMRELEIDKIINM